MDKILKYWETFISNIFIEAFLEGLLILLVLGMIGYLLTIFLFRYLTRNVSD